MRNATKICRICGKEYPACKAAFDTTLNRWQDVACCVEHGAEYFARIAESRGSAPVAVEEAAADAAIETKEIAPVEESADESDEAPVSKRRKKRV